MATAGAEETAATALAEAEAATLTLEILQIIKESQQQHGLRHGDYQRYRGYCSRRLRRLRKALNFKMGNRHKYTGRKVTVELLKDPRYLLLELMSAERAWSYAMQLKQEANTEPRKRFHLVSRLRKAAKHAEALERLCEGKRIDARTKLEAQAYAAYMAGMLRFEKQDWTKAMESFGSCKTIYEKLASAFSDEQAVLYRQRVEEISPNLRYCAYNIGDQSAIGDLLQMRLKSGDSSSMLTEKLEVLLAQMRAKQSTSMSEVTWCGRTVPVKVDRVRVFLLSLEESEAAIAQAEKEEGKEQLYESLLIECRDAIHAVREELKLDPKQRERETEAGKNSNLQHLHSYLTFIKLSNTVERNVVMARALRRRLSRGAVDDGRKAPRPQELIRLYELILQSLTEMQQLPGMEADPDLWRSLDNKKSAYKAFRCYFIAQSYLAAKKWTEGLALFERVLKYAREAQAACAQSNCPNMDQNELEELINSINGEKYSIQATAILDSDDIGDRMAALEVSDNKPLLERLDVYRLDPALVSKQPNLVTFPPEFQPVPVKPLFFDLALNHVALPPLDDKLEQKSRSGFTGMIKGIFGFRS